MTEIAKVRYDVLDILKDCYVTVTPKNMWRFRLGLWLLGVACRVMRCPLRVDINGETIATATDDDEAA